MNAKDVLMALLRAEVCGAELTNDLKPFMTPELLEKVYSLANAHDLAHIAGQALGKLGFLGSDETSNQFRNKTIGAVARYVRLQHEYNVISNCLEAAGIAFLPLKGAVLRRYYPEEWMRTSCDIDILVREETLEAAVSALTDKLNYQRGEKSTHDVSLFSVSGVHLELHYTAVEDGRAQNSQAVLARIWEDASPLKTEPYHYCLSDAMFYFYHIAHMAKHIEEGGCGIRTFLDLWILNHRVDFDPYARDQMLDKGGLKIFARAAERLAEIWFSGEETDDISEQLSSFILGGGAYGTTESYITVKQGKIGSAKGYAYRRIFPPYEKMKFRYPVLEHKKWLLPIFHVVRWITVLYKGNGVRSLRELETNASISGELVADTAKFMKKLGL